MWDDDKLEETEIEEYESEQEEYPGGQEIYQMDAPQQKRRQDKPSGNGSRDGQRSGNRAARPRKSSAARERAEREARREAQQRICLLYTSGSWTMTMCTASYKVTGLSKCRK